ncbi:3-oxoacyl-[acyl-carrier-protein] reductase FabG [Nocardia nova SH22a]|uniref:3-oxoacyl-[acyl-carrier-protein] reductase FabG n=1 Tax=Nocardia nova SH22a TaxID=1415166 RepID=W5TJX7_9NOCA|nr:SDR family oxidoreductase [Nocardia nova]AHH17546.1 3-oxoacyl-[acyl-carrier-protein] reductase FabG [Nocardia nova SH22a]
MGKGTAIVTGGAGTLGEAIAVGLRDYGWDVRIVDRQQVLSGWTAPEGIRADALDVTDFDACRAYFAALDELSVLVNCAGIARLGLVRDIGEQDWRDVLDLNLTAALHLTQLSTELLINSGHGSIVNITSIAGHRASFGRVAYGVSKAGLLQLTRQTALEYAPLGIRCNSVSPGPVDSALVQRSLSQEDYAEYLEDIPDNRMAEPHEVANAVVFLASREATYISGQDLAVDGGFLAGGAGIKKAQRLT